MYMCTPRRQVIHKFTQLPVLNIRNPSCPENFLPDALT